MRTQFHSKQNNLELQEDHDGVDYNQRRNEQIYFGNSKLAPAEEDKKYAKEMSTHDIYQTILDNKNIPSQLDNNPIIESRNHEEQDEEGENNPPTTESHKTFPRSYRGFSPPTYLSTAASIRSESLKSQASDCELSSSVSSDINKKVSFNSDVSIKRIPAQKSRSLASAAGDIFRRASSPEKNIVLQHQKL